MARFESWFEQDLKKPIQVQLIKGNMFSADNQGNLVGVSVLDDGQEAELAGTVSANVIRPDGATVAVSGTLSGNKCSVVLPAAAYVVPGVETITLKLTSGSVVTTLLSVVVTIYRATTDTVVDPGTIIPSVEALIEAIEEAVASIPADYSSLWESLAPSYSTSQKYSIGQYVTYNGYVYRCIYPIAAAESWTAAHWRKVALTDDIAELRKIAQGVIYLDSGLFANGGLYYGEPDSYLSDYRCATRKLKALQPFSIKARTETYSNARFDIYYFDDIGQYATETGWSTALNVVPANKNFSVLLWTGASTGEKVDASDIYKQFEIKELPEKKFEHGSLVDGARDNYRSGTRARFTTIQHNEEPVWVTMGKGAACIAHYFDSNGNYTSNSGWKSNYFTIPANSYYNLILEADFVGAEKSLSLDEILSLFAFAEGEEINITNLIGSDDFIKYFIRGTIMNDGSVSTYLIDARISTAMYMICDYDLNIINTDGYMSVSVFDKETHSLLWDKYWPSEIFVQAGTPFHVTLTKDPSSGDAVSTRAILQDVKFVVEKTNTGLAPNIIWQCRNLDDQKIPAYSKWYIQAAAHNQYDRVRVNVRNTTDGRYVLIHDNTINNLARNPDGTQIEETVYSEGQTFDTLNYYDWGIQYGPKYAGFGVPVLEDACKYAALFNLGLTVETYQTVQADIDEMFTMFSRRGLLEKLIILPAGTSEPYIAAAEYWATKNDHISFAFGITEDISASKIARINALKTGHNEIYALPATWGVPTSDAIRRIIATNGWLLYNSNAMNYAQLIDGIIDSGSALIEVNNVCMIKNKAREYADAHV